MTSLATQWRAARAERSAAVASPTRDITTIDDYALVMGQVYAQTANAYGLGPSAPMWQHEPAESVAHSFEAYANQLVDTDGAVSAIIGVRVLAFSLIRFAFQRMRQGRPSTLFGAQSLSQLETPYPGGTTQDLLMRMMQDCDLAGNAYVTRVIGPAGPEMLRLRPDWVQIILMPIEGPDGGLLGWRRVGYTYHEGGIAVCAPENVALLALNEVAHFAPDPDPFARYRGQSWLTAAMREIVNDKMMETHKTKFFENAATPNISVSLADTVTPTQFADFKAKMNTEHVGLNNAYKTLFLGGGADVKVIGANMQQIDFSTIQGRGETRMAARAGVPPIIVGLSEGLSSSTYSNYGLAMRRFGDLTMRALWQNACGSLATLVRPPGGDTRLWYDTRDVAFLRDDARARADVAQVQATTVNTYITAGFTPDSAVAAVDGEDLSLLVHTGLVSVQLQPPGTTAAADSTTAPAADTSAGASTNAAAAPAQVREVGDVDDVDRHLMVVNGHPHPDL